MLAGIVWDDTAVENAGVKIPAIAASRKVDRLRWFTRMAVAAGVLLAFGFFAAVYFSNDFDQQVVSGGGNIDAGRVATEMTLEEIKRDIAECGRAAKLLAAADILNRDEGLHELAARQYEYIVDMYPKTSAASMARTKLNVNNF